jgi:hypothetical protein
MRHFILAITIASGLALPAHAAKEDGCTGGAFSVVTSTGVLGGNRDVTISSKTLGATVTVQGRFVKFDVQTSNFGVLNYTFTPAATHALALVAFASKTPNLEGLTLSSDISVSIKDETIVLKRTGSGIAMTIQADDCGSGGIFQMEPERGDGSTTDIIHTLGAGVFYFNNPNFGPPPPPLPLCPSGGPFTPACTPIPIAPRVNFASDLLSSFVGRDSPQSATKIAQTGATATWRVASGGRMGGVFGEDAVEVAPPAVACTSHCKAQDQVRGKFPVLGFPSPVPAAARIP